MEEGSGEVRGRRSEVKGQEGGKVRRWEGQEDKKITPVKYASLVTNVNFTGQGRLEEQKAKERENRIEKRGKMEEKRGKRKEGRWKREDGREKREDGRGTKRRQTRLEL